MTQRYKGRGGKYLTHDPSAVNPVALSHITSVTLPGATVNGLGAKARRYE